MTTQAIEATIQNNYEEVLQRIAGAARKAGRDPQEVRLVVVTKGHPLETIQAAVASGARLLGEHYVLLGENYVEEGVEKISALQSVPSLEWHMIGHVQSRKARPVCEHFDWVHSLDSLKLANRLDRFAGELGRRVPVLLECNVSGEQTKFGFPAFRKDRWDALLPEIEEILGLGNLAVRGLMTMAPFLPDPEAARPYFQRLRRLKEFFAFRFPQADWNELSMGMSADFEVAVEEGATLVRVGTSILGPRPERH